MKQDWKMNRNKKKNLNYHDGIIHQNKNCDENNVTEN